MTGKGWKHTRAHTADSDGNIINPQPMPVENKKEAEKGTQTPEVVEFVKADRPVVEEVMPEPKRQKENQEVLNDNGSDNKPKEESLPKTKPEVLSSDKKENKIKSKKKSSKKKKGSKNRKKTTVRRTQKTKETE